MCCVFIYRFCWHFFVCWVIFWCIFIRFWCKESDLIEVLCCCWNVLKTIKISFNWCWCSIWRLFLLSWLNYSKFIRLLWYLCCDCELTLNCHHFSCQNHSFLLIDDKKVFEDFAHSFLSSLVCLITVHTQHFFLETFHDLMCVSTYAAFHSFFTDTLCIFSLITVEALLNLYVMIVKMSII